jgi:hypothetical protein
MPFLAIEDILPYKLKVVDISAFHIKGRKTMFRANNQV